MADNFTANAGAGGDTFAADDVSGVKVPYSKIDIGSAGVSSPVTAANPLPTAAMEPDSILYSGSASAINTDFFVIDCLNIRQVAVFVTSIGGGGTVAWQQSNDVGFANVAAVTASPAAAGAAASSTSAVGLWIVPVLARYLRIRCTAYTSGTLTAEARAYASSAALSQIVQITSTPAVQGTVAHSSAATGSPVQVGGVVATAVSINEVAGDVSRLTMTTGGQALSKPYGLPETDWQYAGASGGIINTTDVVAKTAAGASIRNYVTGMSLSNNSATATEFVVKDGSTVMWRGMLPANAPTAYIEFPTPLRGTANTAINIACITTAAAVYANLQGYTAP